MVRPVNRDNGESEQVTMRRSHTGEVPARFLERIIEVLHPKEIWLFGSRARGTHHEDSDWDLMAVLPDDAPDEHLDIVAVWRMFKDLRLQRVEIFPVRRRDFEEGRHLLGTLSQIVTMEGYQVYG
jgi:predicted nucleotidyltransferase